MKKFLITLFSSLILTYYSNGQTIIYDFETEETSTDFQYFGSTLAGSFTTNIDNPDPTDVNESATVMEYVKAANSEIWAGAFANPSLTSINATNGGTICIDVLMDNLGVLALKLEESITGGSSWLTTQENTVVGGWETLCFDLSENGLEDAMTPAAGHIYTIPVIFPDYGSNDEIDDTTYLDNFILNTTSSTEMSDVVFSVNMGMKNDFTGVFLSGTFNDWSADANPMTDDDGDNVWTTTINVLNGPIEYKFQLDEWAQSETFDGSDICTVTSEDGAFTNRTVAIFEDVDLGSVCYESCYGCDESVNITWNLNMENETVSDLGVYVAGGDYFGYGDLPPMTDDDGDGVYTITLEREIGFTSDYTFINGICLPEWSCKENIAGQPCAVPPFNDRNLAPVMEDIEINTCFGFCSTDGTCKINIDVYLATFRVDMSNETVGDNGMFVSGYQINTWSPDATPMTDIGNGHHEVTVELPVEPIEYKFVNSGNFEDLLLDDCTVLDPTGQFINRILNMEAKDTTLQTYVYETCITTPVGTDNLVFDEILFKVRPSITSDYADAIWNGTERRQILIYSVSGQLMKTYNVASYTNVQRIDASNFESGIYIIRMNTETKVYTQKLLIR